MMGAYDILTGLQLCMTIAMLVYELYFQERRTCTLLFFVGPYFLALAWGSAVVYYYTTYPFLTILCLLMAFFLGLGLAFWLKLGLPVLQYTAEERLLVPPLRSGLLFLVCFVFLFGSIQVIIYHFPFLNHSWGFNEILGFLPGLSLGYFWGRGLAMLLALMNKEDS